MEYRRRSVWSMMGEIIMHNAGGDGQRVHTVGLSWRNIVKMHGASALYPKDCGNYLQYRCSHWSSSTFYAQRNLMSAGVQGGTGDAIKCITSCTPTTPSDLK